MEHIRIFEFENMTIEYHYNKLPAKEDLEEICSTFYKKAMKDKKERIDSAKSIQND